MSWRLRTNVLLRKIIFSRLSPKYVESFSVAEKSALKLSFKVDLSAEFGRSYSTFCDSLLKPCRKSEPNQEVFEKHILIDLKLQQKSLESFLLVVFVAMQKSFQFTTQTETQREISRLRVCQCSLDFYTDIVLWVDTVHLNGRTQALVHTSEAPEECLKERLR